MTLSLLSIALLITSALAAPRPDVEVVQVRQLLKRQDPTSVDLSDLLPTSVDLGDIATLVPSDLAGCLPPSGLPAPPTIPPDVASAIITYTDFCHEPSFTGSVGAQYSSYLSEASKYAEDNGSQLSSWISALSTDCPLASAIPTGAGDLSSLLADYTLPSCGSATQSNPKGTGPTAKPAGSSGTGGAGSSGGAVGAVAAVAGVVAGFAGIIAAL